MRIRCSLALIPLVWTACSKDDGTEDEARETVGHVTVCTDIPPDDGTAHRVSGTVVAIDDGATDCSHSVTVEDAEGAQHVVGWSLTGEDGTDHTPPLDLAEGDGVDVLVRSVLVWGDVQGLVIEDDGGLVVAAEEGTWGGALEADDVAFEVLVGAWRFTEESDCETIEYYSFFFEGDARSEGVSLEAVELTVDGAELQAVGGTALLRGPGTNCEITDQTDELSWIVWR